MRLGISVQYTYSSLPLARTFTEHLPHELHLGFPGSVRPLFLHMLHGCLVRQDRLHLHIKQGACKRRGRPGMLILLFLFCECVEDKRGYQSSIIFKTFH